MSNTITKTTLHDGARNLIQLINILGDGSGDETNAVLVDRSAFTPTDGTELVVEGIEGVLNAFTAALSFDASTDLVFARLAAESFALDWTKFGGVSSNKAGAGAIGDILLTTASLGSGDSGTFILRMRKA